MATRVRNAATTREAILVCARRRFLEESYDNVGLRDVAGDAGVDVALVGRYFGSKEKLFKEVLGGERRDGLKRLGSPDDLLDYLASLAVDEPTSADPAQLERLLIILRSASSPPASRLVELAFKQDVLNPVARLVSGPDAELRASLAISVLMGTTIVRTIMGVEPLHRCDTEVLRGKVWQLLKAALSIE